MKCLAIVRGLNEPDNNTPSDEVWVKYLDTEVLSVASVEKIITDDFNPDYEHGVEVEVIPLEEIKDEWRKVFEIW